MNFLAHLYLSHGRPKLMIGNFIGDFVKGRNYSSRFESQIVAGIELHRAIDVYTDSHEIVKASKNRLKEKYRHYSGVIVDMFYDHYLAKNWNDHHQEQLPIFVDKFYSLIKSQKAILPEKVNQMLPYMIEGNWLVAYGRVEGIHRALTGISKRTSFESKMEEASHDLVEHYAIFESEFNSFFPQLSEFSKQWIDLRGH